jgi:hypothetical protein
MEDEELLEIRANLEHQQWATWINYLDTIRDSSEFFQKLAHWKEQARTYYKYLSEKDKEKDRVFARRVLEVLHNE